MRWGPRSMAHILMAVSAVRTMGADRSGPLADHILMFMGYTEDQADFWLEIAAHLGYIEYGVSARTGWLTDKGRGLWLNLAAATAADTAPAAEHDAP